MSIAWPDEGGSSSGESLDDAAALAMPMSRHNSNSDLSSIDEYGELDQMSNSQAISFTRASVLSGINRTVSGPGWAEALSGAKQEAPDLRGSDQARLDALPGWNPSGENSPSSTYNLRRPVAVSFPSRTIPLLCGWIAIPTLIGVVFTSWSWDTRHEFGSLPYPYLEDVVKHTPQAAYFSFGMTVTSFLMILTMVTNYGKVKNELGLVTGVVVNPPGTKRNVASMICGLVGTPFLGMLACADAARMPTEHIVCSYMFFGPTIAYMFLQTSLYKTLLDSRLQEIVKRRHYKLRMSVLAKRLLCIFFTIFTAIYLPIGMLVAPAKLVLPTLSREYPALGAFEVYLYEYGDDWAVHTVRAICQHLAIWCIISFYTTFYLDFGNLEFFIVQGVMQHTKRKKSKKKSK